MTYAAFQGGTVLAQCVNKAIAPSRFLLSLFAVQALNREFANGWGADQKPQMFLGISNQATSSRTPTLPHLPACLSVATAPFATAPFTTALFGIATFERGDRLNQVSDRLNHLVGVAKERSDYQNPDQWIRGVKRKLRRVELGKGSRNRGNKLSFNRIHHCELPRFC